MYLLIFGAFMFRAFNFYSLCVCSLWSYVLTWMATWRP